MKILVTGGAGFIGSHIVDALVEKHEVTIYDNLEPQVHEKVPGYLNKKAKFIRGDVTDANRLKKVVCDMDVIFHQAAAVGVGQSMYQVERYVNINSNGTAKLLDILANEEHSVKKLIVASSMSIYGEGEYECPDCGVVYPKMRPEKQLKKKEWEIRCPECGKVAKPVPTDEDKPLHPTSVYAVTKRDQEEMCLAVGHAYGIPTVALRYFNVYGVRQSLSNPYTGVCAIFSSRIKNNNPPIIYEDGLQARDFVSVSDIVQANLLVLNKRSADYEAFNVGVGKPIAILDIADILIGLYKKKIKPRIAGKYRPGDIRYCYSDISKIKKLGYKPRTKFEDGIKDLARWGETQKAKDRFEEARKEMESKGLMG